MTNSSNVLSDTIPHQLRGFLTNYQTMVLETPRYDRCTACSDTILNEYKKRGSQFLLEALENPDVLEEITGLKELKQGLEEESIVWDMDEVE